MIEVGLLETDLGMALRAIFTQLALMDVLFFMTSETSGLGGAELFSYGVTTGAGDGAVAALEFVAADGMFERLSVEAHDVCRAALVFVVAGRALRVRLDGIAMEAAFVT